MHDMGYDVSDYEKVLPAYGTVQDVENLVEACHSRGMKVILDLVVNHSSDQHAWFQESRSSKDSEKRDWYFWRPPRYDDAGNRMPPSNYRGYFAGSTCKTFKFLILICLCPNIRLLQGLGMRRQKNTTYIFTPKSSLISTGTTKPLVRPFTTVLSGSGSIRVSMASGLTPSTSIANIQTFPMPLSRIRKATYNLPLGCGVMGPAFTNSYERCTTIPSLPTGM